MEFPLYYFLYAYLAFLVFWAIFSLVGLYHMFRYSWKSFTSFLVVLIFIGVSGFMLLTSYNYIKDIDWKHRVSVFKDLNTNTTPFEY